MKLIVIGASLGGMEALKTLFSQLPPELDADLLVVWHMPPEAANLLPGILQRVSALPVAAARDGEPLGSRRAYLAPPDYHLIVEAGAAPETGVVRLTHGPKENRFRPSVDVLFRSAAVAFGPHVIGVVLTGALDDGASGLYAIKQHGGLAVVQDPLDAECPNMPINALRAVRADHVAPIARMGELLTKLVREPPEEGGQCATGRDENRNLEMEVRVAAGENGLESHLLELGELTPYTCPECHGVLVRIEEGKLTRFRCHTGHAFSLDALLAELTESSERTLWSALRALQELQMLTTHLARHLREAGDHEAAERCLREMEQTRRRTDLVRRAVQEAEVLSEDKLEEPLAAS
jgi:two-component system chemotaxis response regulator CheB